uniref:SCP domain-containing protein n=1 Tax=Globodera pallida TaxID=36090 RepID=A0A183BRA8_GLOPA
MKMFVLAVDGLENNADNSWCYKGQDFCAAASCIYIDSERKATQNVTLWGCVESNEPGCGLKDVYIASMLCDPCFIGEKDVDMTNSDYTGVYPTAVEYKLAGRKPPPPTTPPPMTTEEVPLLKTTTGNGDELSSTMTTTKNGVESAFINPLLVMLTFVMAILCRF